MTIDVGLWAYLAAVLVSAMALIAARIVPIWAQRHQGCDAYYYLIAADMFRRRRRVPIVFERLYMLELREQWYPPGFTMLLSLFPQRFLNHRYWLLNALFDLAPQVVIVVACAAIGGPAIGLLAGLVYAFQAPLLGEYRGLNSRPLGVALFALILSFCVLGIEDSPTWLVGGALAMFALILSHKMSTQLALFLLPTLAAAMLEPLWLVPLAGGYALAFVLTPGTLRRIVRQHLEIVAFWGRHWPELGAHEVRQSPIYGDGRTRLDYYRPGGPTAARHAVRTFVHSNYWAVFMPYALLHWSNLDGYLRTMTAASIAIYAWAAATLCVPYLRRFGMWHQYLKYGYLPVLTVAAHALAVGDFWLVWPLAAICSALTLRSYLGTAQGLREMPASATGAAHPALAPILAAISANSESRVMCTPLHLSDLVAYTTRRRVLWGSHGQGFPLLRRILPVITWPIEKLAQHHRLTHLLLDTRHARPDELRLYLPPLIRSGPFELHNLKVYWAND